MATRRGRGIVSLATIALVASACDVSSPSAADDASNAIDAVDAATEAEHASEPSILRRPDPRRPWSGVVTPLAAVDALQFRVDDRVFPVADLGARLFVLDTRALSDGDHWLGVDVSTDDDAGVTTRWTKITVANGSTNAPTFAGKFVEVGASSGFGGVAFAPLARTSVASAGGIAADLDGDGALEVVAWGTDGVATSFHQTAPWSFAATQTFATGVSAAGAADLDGDGDPDVVTAGDDVRLFRNDAGRLVDVTADAGIVSSVHGTYRGVTFADLDLDGLEDVLVARMDCDGGANLVLHGDGDLHFTDVATSLSLDDAGGATYAFATDLVPDDGALHVWTFHEGCRPVQTSHVVLAQTDALPIASAPIALPEGLPVAPMGSAWIDADGDGHVDLCVSGDFVSPVWLGPRFDANASPYVGLDAFAPPGGVFASQWAMVLLDADFDGRWDVYTVHDPSDPSWDDSGTFDALYWQRGPGAFRDVAPDAGLDGRRACRAAFGADLDGDGDTDVLTGCRDGLRVFRNDLAPAGSGSALVLRGTTSNPDGVHAWARVGGAVDVMLRGGGQPYAGGTSAPSVRANESIEVHWPSGIVQKVDASSAPRVTIVEPILVQLSARRVAPRSPPVAVTIDPAPLGVSPASIVVDVVGASWESSPAVGADGLVHAAIRIPARPSTVTLRLTVDGTTLAVRPRVYVRS